MRISICLIIFFLHSQTKLLAQNKIDTAITLSKSCNWDEVGDKSKKELKNRTGFVFERFGTLIINIKGIAYNPCNMPPGLVGKKVFISGIIYKKIKSDGTPIKLTYLKILSN